MHDSSSLSAKLCGMDHKCSRRWEKGRDPRWGGSWEDRGRNETSDSSCRVSRFAQHYLPASLCTISNPTLSRPIISIPNFIQVPKNHLWDLADSRALPPEGKDSIVKRACAHLVEFLDIIRLIDTIKAGYWGGHEDGIGHHWLLCISSIFALFIDTLEQQSFNARFGILYISWKILL